jgi:Flp pilus assembly protein TadD
MDPSFRRAALFLLSSLAAAGCASQRSQSATPAAVYADYLTGRYADLRRDSTVATDRYFSALRLAPDDVALLDGALESALSAGDMARAAAAAKLAQSSGAHIELGRLTLATQALAERKYAAARAALGGVQGSSFDRIAARLLTSWALAGEGRVDQAIASLSDSETAPFARLLDYQRGLILDYAGRDADALAAYESAERGGVRLAPGLVRHGALLERMGRADDAAALYGSFLKAGEEPAVRAALNATSAPHAPAAVATPAQGAAIGLFSLAGALLGQTDPDFYLPYLTLALSLDPSLDSARLIYAEGLRNVGQLGGARAALMKVAEGSPYYEIARARVAWLYKEDGQDDQALATALAAAASTKGALARTTLADLQRSLEHWKDAETLYDGLIQEIAKPQQKDWPLYFARGACRERLGRWAEGEMDLKRALDLSPDQPDVLNYLGYSWIDKGVHLEEGLALLQKAVAAEPDSGYIIDSLGWALYKLGDYDRAVDTLERAVELAPQDPTLNDHLGDAYWRVKRRTEARFQWSRALSLKPEDSAAIEAKLKTGLPDAPSTRSADAEAPTPK